MGAGDAGRGDDRCRVRERFERRFTARRMAEDYVRLYHALTASKARAATATA